MATCLIGLGSNLGDREEMLTRAVNRLGEHSRIYSVRQSSWHRSSPIGGPGDQEPYLNGAARMETSLGPEALLDTLAAIETELGRQRLQRWGARSIDLDLLLYDRFVCRTPRLTVPHPRMVWRPFVLRPAVEVAGSMVHPSTGWTMQRLLDHWDSAPRYLALAGPSGSGKTRLAERLAGQASTRTVPAERSREPGGAARNHRPGNDWGIQLEFIQTRAGLLGPDLPCWREPNSVWVSDFWFGQSLAYAEVLLPARQFDRFHRLWLDTRSRVVEPKLTALLDVSESERPSEEAEEIREALFRILDGPGHGPVMWLADQDEERRFAEAAAAVEAMTT